MTKSRRNERRNKGKTIAVIAVLLLLGLSLIGLLGGLGNVLKRFFTGTFGFISYAVIAVSVLVAILKGFGFVRKRGKGRTIAFAIVLSLILLVYVQIVTSHKLFEGLSSASYGNYLSACYGAGLKTCGGVILGLLAYPLLALMGKYSAILVAILFFVVLFFALLPLMKTSESEARFEETKREKSNKRSKKSEKKKSGELPLRLFVDSVRSGNKEGAVLKRRGAFSKPNASFSLFDVNDERPFALSAGGSIPESRPERYNLYSDVESGRNSRRLADSSFPGKNAGLADYDDYDYEEPIRTESQNNSSSAMDFASDRASDSRDLPLFIRRYSDEKAQANKKLYGEDRIRDVLPGDPSSELDPAPKKPVAKTPLVDNPKMDLPRRNSDDIIMDVSDLKRINEKTASRAPRSSFLGEDVVKKSETPVKEASVPSIKAQEEVKQETFRFEFPEEPKIDFKEIKPVEPIVSEKAEDAKKQLFSENGSSDDLSEPIVHTDPVEEKKSDLVSAEEKPQPVFDRTITPSDASSMTPKRQEYRAEEKTATDYAEMKKEAPGSFAERATFGARSASVSSFSQETEEEIATPVRQRKPRSDIGGTHYTENKKAETSSFIPPKKAEQIEISSVPEEVPTRPYTPPPVSLLKEFPPTHDEEGVEERAEQLVQALASFNINSQVIDHKTGPTFTQFAVSLPANMSVNKLTPLEKDIKRKLMIEKNIRIIPSVPGLDAVGVEVPNKKTSMIGLRSLISSPDFAKENKLYFAIGVDVSGKAVYGDLLKMPHLLVAGSTGSGKSVCLNVMICSIMYHYSPETVRFIMIDPKKVELSVYKNMPHMVMPSTVTDAGKAINALTWAVNEMDRRYDVLQENNCRNIGEYNELQKKTGGKKMYYIVLIVDEMADLMSRAKRDVEDKIQCLTSKARAAGIHLVVATQRPSVDVITGTIKNNIPTRIAFKVTSVNDSRTILDRGGAESLFGNGDMLYCPPDGGEPVRLQGPYVGDEVLNVVNFIKEHNDCSYDAGAEKFIQADKQADADPAAAPSVPDGMDAEDELFADALLSVIEAGQASISKLQRKFRIGYGRAARIIDTMEERGFIGPTDANNKPRAVLITASEYYDLYGEDGLDGGQEG